MSGLFHRRFCFLTYIDFDTSRTVFSGPFCYADGHERFWRAHFHVAIYIEPVVPSFLPDLSSRNSYRDYRPGTPPKSMLIALTNFAQ